MTDSTDNARGPDLLPCPFCGGVGHMAKDPDMNWGDFYSIKCGDCRAKSPEFHASETCPIFFAQVRAAWNRRAERAEAALATAKRDAANIAATMFIDAGITAAREHAAGRMIAAATLAQEEPTTN